MRTEARSEKIVAGTIFALLPILFLFRLSQPFRSGTFWMSYVQDDFYYYLKIAQNIAQGRGSTFNGIVPTNGYHPLWEWALTAFSYISTKPHAILGFLATMIFLATLGTFFFSFQILHKQRIRTLTALALSLWITLYSLRLFIQGMEVILTVPLVLAFILLCTDDEHLFRGFWRSFSLGLVASLVMLSRLDSIILIALIAAGFLMQAKIRRRLGAASLAGVVLGLTLFAGYMLSNHLLFQTWLPVSGMAKQLKVGLSPSINPWKIMNLNSPAYLLVFLPIPLAILLFPFVLKYLRPTQKAVFGAVLIFPFVYFSILSLRSDWPSWGWYLYSLRTGVCISFVIFCTWPPLRKFLERSVVTYALLCLFLLSWIVWKWPIQTPELYAASAELAQFSQTHPGIYAMGDRSASAGYLMSQPLIQTEGLVMDRHYLDELQSGKTIARGLS